MLSPVLGAWQTSWTTTIAESKPFIELSLLDREIHHLDISWASYLSLPPEPWLKYRAMEMLIPMRREKGTMPMTTQLMAST